MKIHVDNLAADVTAEDLRTLFEIFGKVVAVRMDKHQRGAQVEMSSKTAGKEAIVSLDGQHLKGFDLAVNEMLGRPSFRGDKKPRRRHRRG